MTPNRSRSRTHEYEIGVQSVVFQALSLADLLAELETTGIDQLELWGHHLSPEDGEDEIENAIERIDDADVTICGYGVVDLDDPGRAREHVAFADRLGADYVTVNYPPASDDVTEELIALGEEFGIDVAIHNYSTVHHDDLSRVFSSVDDVREVLERYDHPRLGVCIDTGHFLVMDETPDDVLPDLGDRVIAVHLKDTSEAELEDLPGAGRLDLAHVLGLLDEHADLEAPLVIEYELPAERATEALVEAAENIRAAGVQ
ncbi:sugar phosphate isomerase/epimerase family protein [Halomontanus rarus]|uniref:sugar phosphate isomerase/epimerase family protein n=1 Tax=Halomontanus rarus TaxID=3034020 RepID=UPI0023E7630C|nr:sugar phosphate isomerase/epimerase [Halovivax sp. TS33]